MLATGVLYSANGNLNNAACDCKCRAAHILHCIEGFAGCAALAPLLLCAEGVDALMLVLFLPLRRPRPLRPPQARQVLSGQASPC